MGDSVPAERLALRVGEVARLLGISVRSVWKLSAASELPRPIRLGRSARWLRDEIVAHLERQRQLRR